jgi:hypothetical protein
MEGNMRAKTTTTITLLILGLITTAARAIEPQCSRGGIVCGRAVTDKLTATDCTFSDSTGIFVDYAQAWRFDAKQGQVFSFVLDAPWPLAFYTPWLGVYRFSDDALLDSRGGDFNHTIIDDATDRLKFVVPTDGSYYVTVSTNDGLRGTGPYTLAVTCSTGPFEEEPCSFQETRVIPFR